MSHQLRRWASSKKAAFWSLLACVVLLVSGTLFVVWATPPSPVTVEFTKLETIVGEGAGQVVFTVKLSRPTEDTVTVQFTTEDGTATAPGDYTAKADTITFEPWETEKTISIEIKDDSTPEGEEWACVVLSNPQFAELGGISSTYFYIIDDDTSPPTVQFEYPYYMVCEDGDSVELRLTLSGRAALPVTVTYETKDGPSPNGAVAGTDYEMTTGVVVFDVGEVTKSFTVKVFPDDVEEGDKVFIVDILSATHATLGTPNSVPVTIVDVSRPKPPTFSKIVAKIPSTPPKTLRKQDGSKAEPEEQKPLNQWPLVGAPANKDLFFHCPNKIVETTDNKLEFNPGLFDKPHAVVLLQSPEDLVQSIELSVTMLDLGEEKLAFQVVRDPTDHAVGVGGENDLPTITATGATTATLKTNAKGSFQVLAFLDSNQNGKWNSTEKGLTLYVIMVRANATNGADDDKSEAFPANTKPAFFPNAANPKIFTVQTGDFDLNNPNKSGIVLDGKVTLIGGGPDGRRGLDRVFFAWANNITSFSEVGAYPKPNTPDRTVERIYAVNADKSPRSLFDMRIFRTGEVPLPIPEAGLSFPLLDTGRLPSGFANGRPRDGGSDILLQKNLIKDTKNLDIGQTRHLIAVDSPSASAFIDHLLVNQQLLGLTIQHKYSARLIGWTNSGGDSTPTPQTGNCVGFRTYSHVRYRDWSFTGVYQVTKGANWTWQVVDNPLIPATIALTAEKGIYSPACPTAGSEFEVRLPTALESQALFAK